MDQIAAVKGDDVLRVVIQYLDELGLEETVACLQKESGISLNAVQSKDRFRTEILQGRWENVLQQMNVFSLPDEVVMDLYEHIVCELIDAKEIESARVFLHDTPPLMAMKTSNPPRYRRLENLAQSALTCIINIQQNVGMDIVPLTPVDIYRLGSKDRGRVDLAERILYHLREILGSVLMTTIQTAMKWQCQNGPMEGGKAFDILSNQSTQDLTKPELPCNAIENVLELSDATSPPFVSKYLPNGTGMVVGYADGLIEVRNPRTGLIRDDLDYQSNGEYMLHPNDNGVLSMCISRNSDILITGDLAGTIMVWKVSTGKCLQTFHKAHDGPVLSIALSSDENLIVSGGEDNTARIHGMRSGSTLRKFIGHNSHVVFVAFNRDAKQVVTASLDGRVIIWNAEQMKPIATYTSTILDDTSLKQAVAIPVHKDGVKWGEDQAVAASIAKDPLWLLCSGKESRHVCILQVQWSDGSTPASFQPMKLIEIDALENHAKEGGSINHLACSPKGELVYCTDENRNIYCYNVVDGKAAAIVPDLMSVGQGTMPVGQRTGVDILNVSVGPIVLGGPLVALCNDGYGRILKHE